MSESESNSKYDVIIIDDEASLTDIFQQYILWKYKGWRFLTFNNSLLAFHEIMNHKLNAKVWVVDMMMPQKNGAEVAEAIRAQEGETPVVLAYTALDRQALESAYAEGMQHFTRVINKKEDIPSLLSLIDMWVNM